MEVQVETRGFEIEVGQRHVEWTGDFCIIFRAAE